MYPISAHQLSSKYSNSCNTRTWLAKILPGTGSCRIWDSGSSTRGPLLPQRSRSINCGQTHHVNYKRQEPASPDETKIDDYESESIFDLYIEKCIYKLVDYCILTIPYSSLAHKKHELLLCTLPPPPPPQRTWETGWFIPVQLNKTITVLTVVQRISVVTSFFVRFAFGAQKSTNRCLEF